MQGRWQGPGPISRGPFRDRILKHDQQTPAVVHGTSDVVRTPAQGPAIEVSYRKKRTLSR
jgi:hypothetical protein